MNCEKCGTEGSMFEFHLTVDGWVCDACYEAEPDWKDNDSD